MTDEAARREVIDVTHVTIRPEPLDGEPCSSYSVGRHGRGALGWNAVLGTRDEREKWRAAGERFDRQVSEAHRAYRAVTHHRVGRHLPGARRRAERAKERFRVELAAAEEQYRPVREEIARRLAVHAEEERRAREERARRWEAERHAEEERKRLRRERQERHRAVGARAVWGWIVDEGGTSVFVHRYDVPPAQPLPTGSRRSESARDARKLEKDLLRLGQEGVPNVVWDQAAREAVVVECSTPEEPTPFEEWWADVTRRRWRSSKEVPPPGPRPS
jgi:hypothetical protein